MTNHTTAVRNIQRQEENKEATRLARLSLCACFPMGGTR